MIPAKFSSGEDFKKTLVPEGNHVARIYSVIHIGTNPEEYMGETKDMDKVRISWEFPNELHVFKKEKGEQPLVMSQEYTSSMNEKAKLRKIVENIVKIDEEGAEFFDVGTLVGTACMVQVNHKVSKAGNEYAVVASVTKLPKGMSAPEAINKPFLLDYQENWNDERFAALPDFIREKMRTSYQYRSKFKPGANSGASDDGLEAIDPDSIPF